MPPKRQYLTLKELLEMQYCYYCDTEFADMKALQDHMKAMHLRCHLCHKKLDSIGGLRVHVESVHKERLPIVLNAIPERSDPDGPEIWLMEGIPAHIKAERDNKIINGYHKMAHDHKVATGNPLPGSEEAQQRAEAAAKGKRKYAEDVLTPEEKKAKRDAFIAERKRAKLELSNPQNGTDEERYREPRDIATLSLQERAMRQDRLGQNAASSGASPVNGGYQGPPFIPQPPYVHGPQGVFNQGPPAFPPQPTTSPGGWQSTPFQQYSQPPPALAPNMPTSTPYRNIPHGGFVKTEPGVTPPPAARSSSAALPSPASVPGLPQRPNFNAPNYTKEDMARIHNGGASKAMPSAPGVPAHAVDHNATVDPQSRVAVKLESTDESSNHADLAAAPSAPAESEHVAESLADQVTAGPAPPPYTPRDQWPASGWDVSKGSFVHRRSNGEFKAAFEHVENGMDRTEGLDVKKQRDVTIREGVPSHFSTQAKTEIGKVTELINEPTCNKTELKIMQYMSDRNDDTGPPPFRIAVIGSAAG